jgi:uncharacterized protein YcbX
MRVTNLIEVGTLAAIHRYPVKSMAGEPLEQAEASWHGITGDRRWAFVRGGMERSTFPWLTMRENPQMGQYRAYFTDPEKPDTSATMVKTPEGDELDVVDPALAARLGFDARVLRQGRGVFDTFPLSLISTTTVAAIGSIVGVPTDERRFRPNFVVKPHEDIPFAEDGWVEKEVTIGEFTMRVDKRDKRCVMINVDPDASTRDPAFLRAVAQHRDACLGVYGTVVRPGTVKIGDPVLTSR